MTVELRERIDRLEEEIDSRLDELEARLDKLEAKGEVILGKLGPEGTFIFAEDGSIAGRIDGDRTVHLVRKG